MRNATLLAYTELYAGAHAEFQTVERALGVLPLSV